MHPQHSDRSAAAAIFANETYFVDTPRIILASYMMSKILERHIYKNRFNVSLYFKY
jgi:hypothetical protein